MTSQMEESATTGSVLRVVALVSRSGRYGGPSDTALRQAVLARKVGFRVEVLAGAFKGDEPEERDGLVTCTVRHVWSRASFTDVFSWRIALQTWKSVGRSDVVHVSAAREPVPLLAALVGRLRRKRLIVQPHGMLTSRTSRLHRALDHLIVKPVLGVNSHYIALTQEERDDLRGWGVRGEIFVVGNPPLTVGLSDDAASQPNLPSRSALFAARLHPRKRVLDFARAAAVAESRGWDEMFSVLGPDEGDLDPLSGMVQKIENLQYLGSTDSSGVVRALREHGCFVLPSVNEPWGNVLVTALALGRPAVVTRSSALAGVISEYRAGVVVEDGRPEELASAVHEVLDPSRASDYAKSASRLASDMFSADRVSGGLVEAYRSL